MTTFLWVAALFVGVLMAVGLHRVWAGPTVFDRLVAVALVTANSVVVVVLVAAAGDRVGVVVDIALGYALLAFVLPVAVARYLEQRNEHPTPPGEGEP